MDKQHCTKHLQVQLLETILSRNTVLTTLGQAFYCSFHTEAKSKTKILHFSDINTIYTD